MSSHNSKAKEFSLPILLALIALAGVIIMGIIFIMDQLKTPAPAVIPPSMTTPDNITGIPDGLTFAKGVPFIAPIEVDKGQIVTIKVKVTNSSPVQIIYPNPLKVNGLSAGSPTRITIEPFESKDITFLFTAEVAGTNDVTVGNLQGIVFVRGGSYLEMFPLYAWIIFGVLLIILVLLLALVLMKAKNKGVVQPAQFSSGTVQITQSFSPGIYPPKHTWETRNPVGKDDPEDVDRQTNLLNGRYELTREGYKEGGMAIINVAKNYQDLVWVIIKTPRSVSGHAMQLNIEKLKQEAEYLKRVDHQNIVKFIDFFYDQDGMPNLVLEYIDGGDLLNRYKFAPADEQTAVKSCWQILDALEYIHGSGFIHRDLNPGNIMVRGNGEIALIDFGTIKSSGYSSDTVFFKPGFVIPEVSAKGYADKRSDIYGVGSTLYYMLTCERPGFIKERDVVSLLIEKGVSQRTAKCVDQALQLDPNFRFQSADAMRRALTGG